DGRIQFFKRTGLACDWRFQLYKEVGGGAMHQQLMPAVAIQVNGAHVHTAADGGLLEQYLERGQHAAEHLADVLEQR
ncbi:hypothetical protein ABTH30_24985, partial [Acinetobacter baumannii]